MGITAESMRAMYDYSSLSAPVWDLSPITVQEAAELAEACYDDPDTRGKECPEIPLPNQWQRLAHGHLLAAEDDLVVRNRFHGILEKVLPTSSPSFLTHVFYHPERNEVMIGFAGMQKIANLLVGAEFSLVDSLPYWERVDAFIHEKILPIIQEKKPTNIRVLGHSLGGTVATLVGNHLGCESLSLDGPAVGDLNLIHNRSPEAALKAKTIAVFPNAINQFGTLWGTMHYVLPNKSYLRTGCTCFKRLQRTTESCSTLAKIKGWLSTDDPANLAIELARITVESHGLSNFTRGKTEVADDYVRALSRAAKKSGGTWHAAKTQFLSSLTDTYSTWSAASQDFARHLVGGAQIGSRLGLVTGYAAGHITGTLAGGATGGAVAASVTCGSLTSISLLSSAGLFSSTAGATSSAFVASALNGFSIWGGLSSFGGFVAMFAATAAEVATTAAAATAAATAATTATAAVTSATAATIAAATATAATATTAAATAASAATAAFATAAGVTGATAAFATVAVTASPAVGIAAAVTTTAAVVSAPVIIPVLTIGLVTLSAGLWGATTGAVLASGVLSPITAVLGTGAGVVLGGLGGAVGFVVSMPKTLQSALKSAIDLANGSVGAAFFTASFIMIPRIHQAFHNALTKDPALQSSAVLSVPVGALL